MPPCRMAMDPNAGYLWKIDDPLVVDDVLEIPHNYWVRGLVAEVDVYKRSYKQAGYTHYPTAVGYDFLGPKTVQVKSVANPTTSNAVDRMKKAIDNLVDAASEESPLRLHILAKPGTDTGPLENALNEYKASRNLVDRLEILVQHYDIGPQ